MKAKLLSAERVEKRVLLTFESQTGIIVKLLVSDADCFNSMIDKEPYVRPASAALGL